MMLLCFAECLLLLLLSTFFFQLDVLCCISLSFSETLLSLSLIWICVVAW
uniref:Uncharacterized protein n=1 Tax=Arundo donax TaxID=35708 RepID=A0A0A9DWH0_ARUDO